MAHIISRKACIVGMLLLLFATSGLFSADLTVEYVEGYLDLRNEAEWDELFIGDTIQDDATIRLDEDSVAELSGRGIKLTLTKPGTYAISELIEATNRQKSVGLASLIGGKIKTILEEPKQTQTAVMGVRGAKSEDELEWMSGDTAELLITGKDHLTNGEFVDAIEVLEEAYDFADETEEPEVLFYLSYANALNGDLREALTNLSDVEPDSSEEFFADLIVLKGQLLAQTFAYKEALSWISAYATDFRNDDATYQTLLLLQGISYQGLDDVQNAKDVLNKAVEVNSSSDIGKAAAGVLQQL